MRVPLLLIASAFGLALSGSLVGDQQAPRNAQNVRSVLAWAKDLTAKLGPDGTAAWLDTINRLLSDSQTKAFVMRKFLHYIVGTNNVPNVLNLPIPLRMAYVNEHWASDHEKDMTTYLRILNKALRDVNINKPTLSPSTTDGPLPTSMIGSRERKEAWLRLFGQLLDKIFFRSKDQEKDLLSMKKALGSILYDGSRPRNWADLTVDEQVAYFKNLARLMVDNFQGAEIDEMAGEKYFVFKELITAFSKALDGILNPKIKEILYQGKHQQLLEKLTDGVANRLDETFKSHEIKSLEDALKESDLLAGLVREQDKYFGKSENRTQ